MTAWRHSRPYILRHFVAPAAAGCIAGLLCVAALLWFDIGGLGSLVTRSGLSWVAVPLLSIGFVITFGSVAIGASIMSIAQD